MNIGIPRERRPGDSRIGFTPAGVELLTADGHRCYVEKDAGLGAGFTNEDFTKAGAQIVYSGEEVYGRADLVLKVARPTPEERPWLRPGQTVLAFWHISAASPETVETVRKAQITAIAYEMVRNDDDSMPVLRPMSQIAGRMAAPTAASLLRNDRGGKGILLQGVPGVPPAQVVILGAGMVGYSAAQTFADLGAQVYVLDRNLSRLEALEESHKQIITMISHPFNVRKCVRFADVLVGAVLVPGQRAPILVTREMVAQMRPRSLILDISIDQGGCVETSRPTTHKTPTFVEEGVTHYCVPNMTGVLGRTATHALNNAAWPFVQILADLGTEAGLAACPPLARGVVVRDGQLVAEGVAA